MRGIILPSVVLLLVSSSAGWGSGASEAGREPAPTRASAPSCPLSLPQQEKAIRIFAKMIPTFRHPRCMNCHGGVRPFEEPGTGNHPVKMQGNEMPDGCADCHELRTPLGHSGWRTAPDRFDFAHQSDGALCAQAKARLRNAGRYVNHFINDNGGTRFIEAAFVGDRALNESAQAMVEAFRREPPPGTQGDLIGHAKDYVSALGGELVGSPSCGCVRGKIELLMTSDWTGTAEGNTTTAHVTAMVPLEADSSGLVFTGRAPLTHGSYTVTTPPGCRVDMKPSGGELGVTEARFGFSGETGMAILLAVEPTMSGGTMHFICPETPLPLGPMPLMPWTGEWKYVHQPDLIGETYHFDQFETVPGADLGTERTLIARKVVTRDAVMAELKTTARTTFEFWWVGLKQYE